jgi:hypothetical protein
MDGSAGMGDAGGGGGCGGRDRVAAGMTDGARAGDWMQVYSGRRFWPMDPRAGEIDPLDIAHALSHQCRYAGHTMEFYSVAEHCVHVHDAAPPDLRAWALLHDASEAYLVDVPRPVKPYLAGYAEAEARVMRAVAERFGLDWPMPAAVEVLDRRIVTDERAQAMRATGDAWALEGPPLGVTLQFWRPVQAQFAFLQRLDALGLRS